MAAIRPERTMLLHEADEGFDMRPFDPALAAEVASWVATLNDLRWVAPCSVPPLDAAKVLEWHKSGVHPFLFFDPQKTPVGYGELVPSLSQIGDVWIAHVVIAPSRRNEGIGRRFVMSLAGRAFDEFHAENVSLSVFEDNASGRACYRRCGFRECGARKLRPVWLSEDEPLVDMRLERFDYVASSWKDILRHHTNGADWPAIYRNYCQLRSENDPRLRERIDLILAHIPAEWDEPFAAADLGSGPGLLADAIAEQFPRSTVVALDADPLQVLIGEGALGERHGGRIQFELADLRDAAWAYGRSKGFAMAGSMLALHWMSRDSLRHLYRNLYPTLTKDGIFVNSDHVPSDAGLGWLPRASKVHSEQKTASSFAWKRFWHQLKSDLGIQYLCEEMAADLPVYEGVEIGQSFRTHSSSLRSAGFREVREIWRDGGEGILVAEK